MAFTIELLAGYGSNGVPAYEEVLVEPTNVDHHYRMVASPGLVLGVAAGDLIALKDDPKGRFDVVERGGNVCVQVMGRSLDDFEQIASRELIELGARIDGRTEKVLVYTIPVSCGFPVIEEILGKALSHCHGCEWFYGNVYDPADGVTPLNWWTA